MTKRKSVEGLNLAGANRARSHEVKMNIFGGFALSSRYEMNIIIQRFLKR